MSYLLDTHTLIWAITSPQKLSKTIKVLLEDSEKDILVSSVSFWEIALKASIGKLILEGIQAEDFPSAALETGFRLIDLDSYTTSTFAALKATHHRDPFDRMLIWQCLKLGFTLISKDENIQKYSSEGLKIIW